jgi:hypothetical protein
VPPDRLLLVAAIFFVIGVVWAVVHGSWVIVIVGLVAIGVALALYRLQP